MVVVLAAAAVMLGLGAVLVAGIRTARAELKAVHPPRVTPPSPASVLPGLLVEEVEFATATGVRLSGWYIPGTNRRGVVLVHGYGANRAELADDAKLLHAHGYAVLMFDLRAHGLSGGERSTYGDLESQDVQAATEALAVRMGGQTVQVGVIGFSIGAVAAVLAARDRPELGALILEGVSTSVTDFCYDEYQSMTWLKGPICVAILYYLDIDVRRLAAADAILHIGDVPVLVIHGGADPLVPLRRAEAVAKLGGARTQLLVLPQAGHGSYHRDVAADYDGPVLAFLDRALRPDRPAR